MYPFLRVFYNIQRAKFRSKLDFKDTAHLPMRVHLTDLDIYGEMNNARYLNILELARWDLSVRTNLLDTMKKKRWGFVVAGVSIRYRKRLTALQKFEIQTRLAGMDERWLYVEQNIMRNGVQHTGSLFRTAVLAKRGIVPTKELFAAMQVDWQPFMPDWIKEWHLSDENRPWHQ